MKNMIGPSSGTGTFTNRLRRISGTTTDSQNRYIFYLVIMALMGWSLASYDVNLLVLALPDIAKSLDISQAALGTLGFFVYAAQFCITIFAGYGMDTFGRRKVWMFCLTGSAVFTGLTYFVEGFWQLVAVRALASGLAYAELAVSITIVNEQVPAARRGLLYSIVQGGWPIGVFLASGVYLMFGHLGWRFVFLLGVIPLFAVIIGRMFIRESERFEHVQQLKEAQKSGNSEAISRLLEHHAVDVGALERVSLKQLFSTPGVLRQQLVILSCAWIIYATSFVASNFYIAYWLTTHKQFSSEATSLLLLVSGGIGFFFYVLGGMLGERYGRRAVIIWTSLAIAPLGLLFWLVQAPWLVCVIYFCLYQATNGTWSGAGYAYQGESFPTRMRGTAIGFLSAMQVLGFVLGTILWTFLSNHYAPDVTWLVLTVFVPCGLVITFLFRDIPPGQELEDISQ
ncbi:MFS transporter [Brytella acorum]|uniref:MFS transporter n=1 Tax=Brytella acorum TaxID=2959299 RepID=A0AA35UVB1_9PROT|nr:MFS transporter [Brytella acorum]MDF3625493.1 MFS transporter [Brytella acorum]CAI9120346.1 MFS transporter [Brytella acorum]